MPGNWWSACHKFAQCCSVCQKLSQVFIQISTLTKSLLCKALNDGSLNCGAMWFITVSLTLNRFILAFWVNLACARFQKKLFRHSQDILITRKAWRMDRKTPWWIPPVGEPNKNKKINHLNESRFCYWNFSYICILDILHMTIAATGPVVAHVSTAYNFCWVLLNKAYMDWAVFSSS